MYEHLSQRVNQVIKLANRIAREYELEYVGTEHILLAIIQEGTGLGAQVLLAKGITEEKIRAEIDKLIKSKVMHWESDRIAVIDRMILRIGIAELLYFPDIPPKVTINEAIEIGKIFSTANSGRFINGVLDAILEELKENGTLHKTGRGLLEFSLSHEEKGSSPRRPKQSK